MLERKTRTEPRIACLPVWAAIVIIKVALAYAAPTHAGLRIDYTMGARDCGAAGTGEYYQERVEADEGKTTLNGQLLSRHGAMSANLRYEADMSDLSYRFDATTTWQKCNGKVRAATAEGFLAMFDRLHFEAEFPPGIDVLEVPISLHASRSSTYGNVHARFWSKSGEGEELELRVDPGVGRECKLLQATGICLQWDSNEWYRGTASGVLTLRRGQSNVFRIAFTANNENGNKSTNSQTVRSEAQLEIGPLPAGVSCSSASGMVPQCSAETQNVFVVTHGWQPLRSKPSDLGFGLQAIKNKHLGFVGHQSLLPHIETYLSFETQHHDWTGVERYAFNWEQAFDLNYYSSLHATSLAGKQLGEQLLKVLRRGGGTKTLHMIGHSLGTLVNAYAVRYLNDHGINADTHDILFTILDSPDDPALLVDGIGFFDLRSKQFDSLFFYSVLNRSNSVDWVENFYADVSFPVVSGQQPEFGQPIPGTIPCDASGCSGKELSGHDHRDVSLYYADLIRGAEDVDWQTPFKGMGNALRWDPLRAIRALKQALKGEYFQFDFLWRDFNEHLHRKAGKVYLNGDSGVVIESNSPAEFGFALPQDSLLSIEFAYRRAIKRDASLSLLIDNQPVWQVELDAGEDSSPVSVVLPFPARGLRGKTIAWRLDSHQPGDKIFLHRVKLDGFTTEQTGSASLGDLVWVDENMDGVKQTKERGLEGVRVELHSCAGDQVSSTVTDGQGRYLFENLLADQYYLVFKQPEGFDLTVRRQGKARGRDSDAYPDTGATSCVRVRDDSRIRNVDAGFVRRGPAPDAGEQSTARGKGRIGDRVWHDANANGVQDPGENGVQRVVVELLTCDGTSVKKARTNKSGRYMFRNLPKGNYVIRAQKPKGYRAFSPPGRGVPRLDSDVARDGRTPCVSLLGTNRNLDVGLVR